MKDKTYKLQNITSKFDGKKIYQHKKINCFDRKLLI